MPVVAPPGGHALRRCCALGVSAALACWFWLLQVDMPYVAAFLEAHAAQAKAIGKPCVIEEFGKFVGALLVVLYLHVS